MTQIDSCYQSIVIIQDTVCIESNRDSVVIASINNNNFLIGENIVNDIYYHNNEAQQVSFVEVAQNNCAQRMDTLFHQFQLSVCQQDSCILYEPDNPLSDTVCSSSSPISMIADKQNSLATVTADGNSIINTENTTVFDPSLVQNDTVRIYITTVLKCGDSLTFYKKKQLVTIKDCEQEPKDNKRLEIEELFSPINGPLLLPSTEDGIYSIYTFDGNLINTLNVIKNETVFWDGKDQNGQVQSLGVYIIEFKNNQKEFIHKIVTLIR